MKYSQLKSRIRLLRFMDYHRDRAPWAVGYIKYIDVDGRLVHCKVPEEILTAETSDFSLMIQKNEDERILNMLDEINTKAFYEGGEWDG